MLMQAIRQYFEDAPVLTATALVHDLVLVTRNKGDVQRSGVRLLNPFSLT